MNAIQPSCYYSRVLINSGGAAGLLGTAEDLPQCHLGGLFPRRSAVGIQPRLEFLNAQFVCGRWGFDRDPKLRVPTHAAKRETGFLECRQRSTAASYNDDADTETVCVIPAPSSNDTRQVLDISDFSGGEHKAKDKLQVGGDM
jgi:hypothetical protein